MSDLHDKRYKLIILFKSNPLQYHTHTHACGFFSEQRCGMINHIVIHRVGWIQEAEEFNSYNSDWDASSI